MNTATNKQDIINEIVDVLKKYNLTYTEGKDILLASCKQIGNTIISSDSLRDNL